MNTKKSGYLSKCGRDNEKFKVNKPRGEETMVFKVDFEKVYDMVCWDFLQEVMEKIIFGNKWCAWIRGCLESSMASILVNGSPTDEFHVKRGLRQGDPLSPFLFILVMEGLHMVIEKAISTGRFPEINVGMDNILVSYLLYANNAIFLGEWSNTNINIILLLLRCFFLASGLKINLSKCKLMAVGVSTTEAQQMASIIGCEETTLPFVYLGEDVCIGECTLKEKFPQIFRLDTETNAMVNGRIVFSLNSGWLQRRPRRGGAIRTVELTSVLGEFLYLISIKSKDVPIKIIVFIWKLILDKLLTRDKLEKKGLDIPSTLCGIYDVIVETGSHVFMRCQFALEIWRQIARWWDLDIPHMLSMKELLGTMDTTIDQQVAMDKALIPHARRLRIGWSNFHLLSDISSKESTLQLVYDVLRLTPFFKAFLVTADVPEIYMHEFWATATVHHHSIRFKMDNKKHIVNLEWNINIQRRGNEMYYPWFTKVIIDHFMSKDPSIPRRNKVNWHYVKDDHMFTTIKLKTRSSFDTTVTPPTAVAGPRLTISEKCKQAAKASEAKSLSALSEVAMTEVQQLKLATKRSLQQTRISQASGSGADEGTGDDDEGNDGDDGEEGDNDNNDQEDEGDDDEDDQEEGGDDEQASDEEEFIHPSLSTHSEEETRDEESFDPIPKTPKNTDDEGNGEENLGKNVGREEGHDEEEEEDELYRDLNINLGRGIQTTQEFEDSHVTLTPVNPDGQQQSSFVSSQFVTSMLNLTPDAGLESIFKTTSQMDVQTLTSVAPLPMFAPTLTPSTIATITTTQQNEDTVTLKRRHDDDADKDEEPSAGSDWGSKRCREGKEPESVSAPQEKATRSAGKTASWPSYELMKGSCKSLVELEFFLEEVYKATTYQLDWVNPEGQQYPHNLLKPLPLISDSQGRRVIPFDHFINNNLEYLRRGASSCKYTTSVTKTKAADYGNIKWIEDLVPRTMWIQEPVGYDKHALWGISHWGRKRQQFYDFAVNRESARDVYSKRRIIAVTELKIVEWHNYKHLDWITLTNLTIEECFAFNVSLRMFTRSIVIQRHVEDLQLGVESYQKKLNLTRSDTYCSDLKSKEAYSAYSNPRGFIYQNKDKQNKLMRIDELHKFSDGTLTDVRTALDDRLKGIRMKYLPKSIWRKSDKDRAAAMI
nr:RNA-directed DNA polymerase, eukaryota [Tanacetum cinerariifolium]